MQPDRDLEIPEGFNGIGKLDLFFVQIQIVLLFGFLGDLFGTDRTENTASLSGFHGDYDSDLLQVLSKLLCIGKALSRLFGLTLFFELEVIFIFVICFYAQLFGVCLIMPAFRSKYFILFSFFSFIFFSSFYTHKEQEKKNSHRMTGVYIQFMNHPIIQALAPCPMDRLLYGHRACLSRTLYGDSNIT